MWVNLSGRRFTDHPAGITLWDWLVVRAIECGVEVPLETPLQQLMFENMQVVGAVTRPDDCPSTVPPWRAARHR